MKALIVDDEREICLLLSHQLKKLGFEPNVAHTISDGLTYLDGENFDLIFLDIHLPDGNGLDFVPRIRRDNSEAKIVVISAYNSNFEQKKAQDLGVFKFLGKPFSTQMIVQLVDSIGNNNS